ncbi:MAG: hypothetical protein WD696_10200, partial [Bryobacteraceae bacterium]
MLRKLLRALHIGILKERIQANALSDMGRQTDRGLPLPTDELRTGAAVEAAPDSAAGGTSAHAGEGVRDLAEAQGASDESGTSNPASPPPVKDDERTDTSHGFEISPDRDRPPRILSNPQPIRRIIDAASIYSDLLHSVQRYPGIRARYVCFDNSSTLLNVAIDVITAQARKEFPDHIEVVEVSNPFPEAKASMIEDVKYELDNIMFNRGSPQKRIVFTKIPNGYGPKVSERKNAERSLLILITDAHGEFLKVLQESYGKGTTDLLVFGYGFPLPPGDHKKNIFMHAAADGDLGIISRVLAEGIDVNSRWTRDVIYDKGSTALMVAAWKNR